MSNKSQAAIKKKIAAIVNSYDSGDTVHESDSAYLCGVYLPYLENRLKKRLNITKISVLRDTKKNRKRYLQPWFHYENGEKETCNKSNAVRYFKTRKVQSHTSKVITAFRNAIGSQTLNFKTVHLNDNNECKCANCNMWFDFKKVDVDHAETSHREWINLFLKQHNLVFDCINVKKDDSFVDKNLEKLWFNYHKKNAILRILCIACHCKIGVRPRTRYT